MFETAVWNLFRAKKILLLESSACACAEADLKGHLFPVFIRKRMKYIPLPGDGFRSLNVLNVINGNDVPLHDSFLA